jgi:uncharacterized membrane protein YgdD (TMEM256/DUF423 family)
MRLVNIFSALTGALAFIMLAVLRHGSNVGDYSAVLTGGLAQLSAAAAGLAIAGRTGRLNIIAAAILLIGANIFAGVIYSSALMPEHPFRAFAPIGGSLLILGWIVLAFASPARR